jgi:hypothetical protein
VFLPHPEISEITEMMRKNECQKEENKQAQKIRLNGV